MTVCDAGSVVIQTCQRGNLLYVFYDVYSVIGPTGCGPQLFLFHHHGFHLAETEREVVGDELILLERGGAYVPFSRALGGLALEAPPFEFFLSVTPPPQGDFSAGKLLCFWKSVVSHWSVEGRTHRAQPPPVMASKCSEQGACVQNCSYTPTPLYHTDKPHPKNFSIHVFSWSIGIREGLSERLGKKYSV